jgi:hypothetical protein
MERENYYVYELSWPNGDVFYVGKGTGNRYRSTIYGSSRDGNVGKVRAITRIREFGFEPTTTIVTRGLTEQKAHELERTLIRKYGRADLKAGQLVNLTDGGEGASGHVQTPQEREAKRLAAMRPEVREQKSSALKDHYSNPVARQKLSASRRRSRECPEFAAKMDDIRAATFSRPEVKEKRKKHAAEAVARPEVRSKLSAAQKRFCSTPEGREAKRKAAMARWHPQIQ